MEALELAAAAAVPLMFWAELKERRAQRTAIVNFLKDIFREMRKIFFKVEEIIDYDFGEGRRSIYNRMIGFDWKGVWYLKDLYISDKLIISGSDLTDVQNYYFVMGELAIFR